MRRGEEDVMAWHLLIATCCDTKSLCALGLPTYHPIIDGSALFFHRLSNWGIRNMLCHAQLSGDCFASPQIDCRLRTRLY